MKFTKKRTDPFTKETTGDFVGFDPAILSEALAAISARCDTSETEITVFPIDPTAIWSEQSEAEVRALVLAHGNQEQVDARVRVKDVEAFNAPIKAELSALDQKRIRPLAEGDAGYLKMLNDQILALRATLKK